MRVPRDKSRRLLGFARRMRREATDAERKLWRILRSGRLYGWKFRRQHPVGGYILDFYCIATHLAVELDGNQHGEESNAKYDESRTAELSRHGVRMARFWDYHVLTRPEVVAREILRLCDDPRAVPQRIGAWAVGLAGGELPADLGGKDEDPHPSPLPEYRARE